MRYSLLALAGIVFMLLASVSLAHSEGDYNISLSIDKQRVLYGENFTLTGKIMYANGTAGMFDYRAAVVAPKRIVVCDSNKTQTDSNGTFSFKCHAPTLEEALALGIPAASERAVIPLRAGVAVRAEDNDSVKKHKEILTINPDKLKTKLDKFVSEISKFTPRISSISGQCDKISERALKYNLTNISDRCDEIKNRIDIIIDEANNLSDQAKALKDNLNSSDFKDFRAGLSLLQDDFKNLTKEIKELQKDLREIKWDKMKEVKGAKIDRIREKAKDFKERIKEHREKERD